MELLAPAGSIKHLRIALDAGADAVYLGGKLFNARSSAANLDESELREATKLCHLYGAKLYVTVNILIADNEMRDLKAYLLFLAEIGVDAIIVQDIGVAGLAQKVAPELEIHASTQMTVTNLEGVCFLANYGFTRVVLARELSIEEVREIVKLSPIEIEVFIHGAICVCYSGQCLMSSMIGGRSGNRGDCAQPCRLPYDLLDAAGNTINPANEKYIMSPKDMISDAYIQELREIGVASLKIEGRMKRVDYVQQVVSTYRAIMDAQISDSKAHKTLQESFNRGYTDVYWRDDVGKELITGFAPNRHGKIIGQLKKISKNRNEALFSLSEKPGPGVLKYIAADGSMQYILSDKKGRVHWQDTSCWIHYDKLPLKEGYLYWQNDDTAGLSGEMKDLQNKIPIQMDLEAIIGEPVVLRITDADGNQVMVRNDFVVEEAHTRPTDLEMIAGQLGRLGNTVFMMESIKATTGNYMIPKSVLNHLRTEGIAKLEKLRIGLNKKRMQRVNILLEREQSNDRPDDFTGVSVHVRNPQELAVAVKAGAREIVYGGESYRHLPFLEKEYEEASQVCKRQRVRFGIAMPRIQRQKENILAHRLWHRISQIVPDFLVLCSYGDYEGYRHEQLRIPFTIDASLNVFNTAAQKVWEALGTSRIMLSVELTLSQIRAMGRNRSVPLEIYACGRTEMMVTENCVINAYVNGAAKKICPGTCMNGNYRLRDRMGKNFPLVTDQFCRMHILNSEVTDVLPHVHKLHSAGVNVFRIDAGGISLSELAAVIQNYNLVLTGRAAVGDIKSPFKSVTRGHLFRGIL